MKLGAGTTPRCVSCWDCNERRMSVERLTARTENGNAYLVNVKPDEQEEAALKEREE